MRRFPGGYPGASRVHRTAFAVTALIVALTAWAAATYGGLIPSYFLATPGAVLTAGRDLFVNKGFQGDIVISLVRIWTGFLISALVAIPTALLLLSFPYFDAFFTPVISFLRYLPVPALVPFTILWFGVGESQKILIVFLGVFLQLVLMVYDILQGVPADLLDVGATLGANSLDLILKVVLPYCAPMIFDALRVTFGWAWGWVMVAELVGAERGIGFVILRSERFLLNADMIVALLVLGVLGLLTDRAFDGMNRRLFPWVKR